MGEENSCTHHSRILLNARAHVKPEPEIFCEITRSKNRNPIQNFNICSALPNRVYLHQGSLSMPFLTNMMKSFQSRLTHYHISHPWIVWKISKECIQKSFNEIPQNTALWLTVRLKPAFNLDHNFYPAYQATWLTDIGN